MSVEQFIKNEGPINLSIKVEMRPGINEAVLKAVSDGIEAGAKQIAIDAINNAPAETGKLKQSIKYKVDGSNAEISANTPYAVYVEYGTGKYAQYFRFSNKPKWVYYNSKWGRFVTTSGSKRQSFMRPALYDNTGVVRTAIENRIVEALR